MKNRTLRILAVVFFATVYAVAPVTVPAQQQGGTTQYVYDDNGRLHAVILPTGEAAVYEYDAAGNITAIKRQTADTLAIFSFSPHEGISGDLVTFTGTGFSAGVSGVSFNGASARIVSASATTIVAAVPDAATSGTVTITTARGSIATPIPFTVKGVRISPTSARLLFNETVQFTATVASSLTDQSVKWSVNGIIEGNAIVGTISPTGLYTASNKEASLILVRATSNADPSLFAEAQVSVRDPNSFQQLFAPGVAVQHGLAGNTIVATVNPVSVRHGNDTGINAAFSASVSVRRGALAGTNAFTVSPVSVQYGHQAGLSTAQSSYVSVTTGPAIVSVSPGTLTRNTTVTLTISGANLSGATALKFVNSNGALDSYITVSNLTTSADGSTLTATIVAGASAPAGQYVVVVTTPAGSSPDVSIGPNVIVVAQ